MKISVCAANLLFLFLACGCAGGPGGEERASLEGYVLFTPLLSGITYLIDRGGRVVHAWKDGLAPGASVYLLDDGHLLRPARDPEPPLFIGGGQGGRIQKLTWERELVWDFVLASDDRVPHHDIEPLPNGNVLAIVWERMTREEAIRAGRRPELVPEGGLWLDGVLEIEPVPPDGGRVVWEWHARDHLVSDSPADHPELIDINGDTPHRRLTSRLLERFRALGYVAGGTTGADPRADFLHINSIAYNPELDQILLSVFYFNEIWILDHSTTILEAAGHSGGRSGRGGDLVYRWGNPRSYGQGTGEDRQLFGQHDARWLENGNILVFDNGLGRPGADYSRVLEIEPAGSGRPVWIYTASPKTSFYADFISGAHRLENGNTFICDGPAGRFFEVTALGETVWEYVNPYSGDAPNPAGDPARSVFRATHIPPDHPALSGRTLAPLDPQPRP